MEHIDKSKIYNKILSEIMTMRWKPGDIISENYICSRFSISRTPARNCLQRLEENGLVKIIPKKGTVVTKLDLNIINQLIYLRVAVESAVLRDFINIATPLDREKVRFAMLTLEQFENCPDEQIDSADFIQKDFNMHKIWFKKTSKEYLWNKIILEDANYVRYCALDIMKQDKVQIALEDHRRLLALIDNKDINGIENILSNHLYGGMIRLTERLSDEFKLYFNDLK